MFRKKISPAEFHVDGTYISLSGHALLQLPTPGHAEHALYALDIYPLLAKQLFDVLQPFQVTLRKKSVLAYTADLYKTLLLPDTERGDTDS